MLSNQSLWLYFMNASIIVKLVMIILFTASVISWTLILQRLQYYQEKRRELKRFIQAFYEGEDLGTLYAHYEMQGIQAEGIARIFHAGFKEFIESRGAGLGKTEQIMQNTKRAMQVATNRELDQLEKHLPFLASVGSVSPYIGLFGTVWGIMAALQALGNVEQVTIGMVAPGISEALIATAMGLLAAIPAVIANNRFSVFVERTFTEYTNFQEEFINVLYHELHG